MSLSLFRRGLLAACLPLLAGCSGVSYLAENGVSQWKLFNRARPVEEVLASPRTEEKARLAIETVARAKKFAVELGLKATANYEKFVQLDGECLLWAVSAAHPLELTERKWKFPLVGEVPYLGFFRRASADAEAARLKAEGNPTPDTWVRCVPAYSSLGWFADPLYSSMLRGKERDIAELVIHESVHATVWVKGSVDFNEQLANFVGLEGSLRFAAKEGGAEGLGRAKREVAGEKLFGDFLQAQVDGYKREVKDAAAKSAFYEGLPARYDAFLEQRKKAGVVFERLPAKLQNWNNAALLAFSNYYADFSVFEALLKSCDGHLGRFVNWIAREQEKGTGRFGSAPEEYLRNLSGEGVPCPP